MADLIWRPKARGRAAPQAIGKPGAGRVSRLGRNAQLAVKRGMDIAFAVLALGALCMLLAALWIISTRAVAIVPTPGRNGCSFGRLVFVFAPGRLSRFMRDTGLERLPELINLLKGDVSLVGPRPGAGGADRGMRPGLIGWDRPGYARRFSLFGDLHIIASVIARRG